MANYLTQNQRRYNEEEFIRILKSTRRKGLEPIIEDLRNEGFFDAQCHGHDKYPGGTLNHCLWVCKLALENLNSLSRKFPDKEIPKDYNVKIVSLLHDVCDSNGFKSVRSKEGNTGIHGKRSMLILERYKRADGKGTVLEGGELNAIKRHMHPKAFHREAVSTRYANDWKTLLHYILKNADGRSVEYYGNIPYGTPERKDLKPHFDLNGVMFLPVCPGYNKDIKIWRGDYGEYHLSILDLSDMKSYVEQRDFAGCKNFIFYISRFPEYRNSYVLAQSGFDGLWRSYCFHNDDSSIEPVCLDGANTPEDARKLMKHSDRKQFYIRVMHSGCFECIDCRKVGIKR